MRWPQLAVSEPRAGADEFNIHFLQTHIITHLFEGPHGQEIADGIGERDFPASRQSGRHRHHIGFADAAVEVLFGEIAAIFIIDNRAVIGNQGQHMAIPASQFIQPG